MGTTIERIQVIFEQAEIKFDVEAEGNLLRTIWARDRSQVVLLVFLLDRGNLVQLRAPALLRLEDDAHKPMLFRAMLQMAYEMRLVQFEYDPGDGEISTCIDIALEDATLTSSQLLRCCSVLLDVSFLVRKRLTTILKTGKDPVSIGDSRQGEEPRKTQLEEIAELAKLTGGRGGKA